MTGILAGAFVFCKFRNKLDLDVVNSGVDAAVFEPIETALVMTSDEVEGSVLLLVGTKALKLYGCPSDCCSFCRAAFNCLSYSNS